MYKLDVSRTILDGVDLRKQEIGGLEELVKLNPNDLNAHAKLLGYYQAHKLCCVGASESAHIHLLWLIEHWQFENNRCASCFQASLCTVEQLEEAKATWEKRIKNNSKDSRAVSNFAAFLESREPERAHELYLHALSLRPSDKELKTQFDFFVSRKTEWLEFAKRLSEDAHSLPGCIPLKREDGTSCDGDPN